MRESTVIQYIEDCLKYADRYYVNVHGSTAMKNGTSDIISCDSAGTLLCVEGKAPNAAPVATQWLRAIEVVYSGGRYVIAQDDFDLDDVDNHEVKTISVPNDRVNAPLELAKLKITATTEVVRETN